MIEQELRDDPYAQEAFSKLLRMVIEETEKLFGHPLKQYLLFREFEAQVEARKLSDIRMRWPQISMRKRTTGYLKRVT